MAPPEDAGAADHSNNRSRSFGRKKIPIQKIESKQALQVTFSKRRQGLFKKASDLSILCGVPIAVIAFSPAGKPFSFGSPSVYAVLDRYLNPAASTSNAGTTDVQPLLNQLQESSTSNTEKPVSEMGLAELQGLQERLVESRRRLAMRADELSAEKGMAFDCGSWLDNYFANHVMED